MCLIPCYYCNALLLLFSISCRNILTFVQCTTLLKMLANMRNGYAEVSGDVNWGTMGPKEVEQYKGQIVMNTEEELFFPSLTVGQTIDFATRMKGKHIMLIVHSLADTISSTSSPV